MHMTYQARFFISFLAVLLSACSSGTNPVVQTMQYFSRPDESANTILNPNFRYLRVVVEGRVAFLALGNVDRDARGTIEVWYSAEREVLRLQNGRLAGAAGLSTEWRSVMLPALPSWSELSRSEIPTHWVRTRDVMPGYHFGIRDTLVLQRLPVPPKSNLRELNAGALVWFEERGGNEDDAFIQVLPPARYAVEMQGEKGIVVYGEQCLAPELCFSWQYWPPATSRHGAPLER